VDEYLRLLAQQDATQRFFNRGPDPEPVSVGQRVRQFGGFLDKLGEQTMGRLLTLAVADPQKEETQRAYGRALGTVTDFTPGAGDIKAIAHDAPELFAQGHPVWGTVAAASGVPLFGVPLDMVRGMRGPVQNAVRLAGHVEEGGRHYVNFDVTGPGREMGSVRGVFDPETKDLKVDVMPFAGRGELGPGEVRRLSRDLVSQLRELGLEVNSIGGTRVKSSGAGTPLETVRTQNLSVPALVRSAEGAERLSHAGGPQPIVMRHYGRGANEDILDPAFSGTGPAAGRERARADRQLATHFYIPELVGRGPMPERALTGQPYVDVEVDASKFLNPDGWAEYMRRAEEVVDNPQDRAAVASAAEKLAVADGVEGLIDTTSGTALKWTPTDLRPFREGAETKPTGAGGNGIERVASQAFEYAQRARAAGRPLDPPATSYEYLPVSEDKGRAIADIYESLPHAPNDPRVQQSYRAFADETMDQWNYLTGEKGVRFEATVDDPYKSSADMIADVRENNRLRFFLTDLNDFPADHPLAQKTGIMMDMPDGTQQEMVYNDLFRAVHDYFGHAAEGFQFGPRGEENAWGLHSAMYSPAARPAMSFETRGQNSWVNFGPQMRGADGQTLRQGDEGYLGPAERAFAPQKANILPEDMSSVAGGPGGSVLTPPTTVVPPPSPTTPVADLVRHARTTGTRAGEAYRKATQSTRAFEQTRDHIASLLPLERADEFLRMNAAGQRNTIKAYAKSIDAETLAHAALAGRAARGWYTSSEQAIRSTFGVNAPVFTAILAASSPNVPVPTNVTAALDIYGDWIRAGRTTDEATIRAIAKNRQPGLADFADNMVRVFQASPEELARTDNVLLSGPKVEPFRKNLLGDPNFVTQDVHTGRLLGGGAPGVSSRSLAGEAKHIEAARILSDWTGVEVTPSEVQEMSWSFIRALNEAGGKEDPVATLTRLFENGGLMSDMPLRGDMTLAEWIGDNHSIGTLLHRPENAERLRALGRGVPSEIKPSGFGAGAGVEINPAALFEAAERYNRSKTGRALYSVAGALGVRSASDRLRDEREGRTARRY